MKTVVVKIKGVSPYQQGRFHKTEKTEKEQPADYEKRTWQEKAHYDKDGNVFIPPLAVKNCLVEAGKYTSKQIAGQGKKTYTQKFMSGILITEPVFIGKKIDDAKPMWVFGDSKGKRGGTGGRVEKCFPTFPEWEGDVTIYVLDEIITEDVLKEHLLEAGRFIGIGVFRPANNGYYGRFDVEKITWLK